jgi:ABC-type transport system involved in multi-copper enzyme maturation permease subunit
MGVANILFGLFIIAGVLIGSVFVVNYYSSQPANVDTFGNTPTATQNDTAGIIINGTATGVNAEGGLLVFVAALLCFAILALYVFKRY